MHIEQLPNGHRPNPYVVTKNVTFGTAVGVKPVSFLIFKRAPHAH